MYLQRTTKYPILQEKKNEKQKAKEEKDTLLGRRIGTIPSMNALENSILPF